MIRPSIRLSALVSIAAFGLALPAFGQTVGPCPKGFAVDSSTPWVLFDLGSAVLRPEAKPTIAQAVEKAKVTQAVSVCLVGQTDKLGDKAVNAQLGAARARAVAAEMVKDGYPAQKIVIAANPEAFGNVSFGSANSSEKDRRVSILFK